MIFLQLMYGSSWSKRIPMKEPKNSLQTRTIAYRKEGKAFFTWILEQEFVPTGTKNVFSKVKKMEHDADKVQPAPVKDVLAVRSIANQSQRDLIDTFVLTV